MTLILEQDDDIISPNFGTRSGERSASVGRRKKPSGRRTVQSFRELKTVMC